MSGAAQGYIGRNPGDSQVTIARQQFTPTGVTTDFTFTSGYTAGYVDVYINGSKILVGRDYTATNGSVVGLTSAAQNGDIVEIVAYKAFNVNNVSESAGNFTVGGILTVDDNTTLSGQLEVTGVTTFTGAVENVVSTGIVTAQQFSGNITGVAATFTGDVSIGGTLTYEDVTNIDSVGIVTARAGVNVSGGQLLVGSGVTIGNAGVATFSGTADVHLHDNIKLNVGDASDLAIYHDGSDSRIQNTTGNLLVRNEGGGDVYLRVNATESAVDCIHNGAVKIYHDNSNKFETTKFGTVTTGIATVSGDVSIADKIIHTGDTNTAIRFPSADTVTVETAGSERLRIDSSGRLLLGATTSRDNDVNFQIEGLGYQSATMQITRNSANADGGGIYIVKTRGSADDASTVVQSGDELGYINFRGADGTDGNTNAATIQAFCDGTPGSNDMPGRLVLSTTADGASSATERLRIASDGQIRMNCTAQPSATVSGYQFDGGGYNSLRISQGGGTSGTDSSGVTVYGGGSLTNIGAAAAMGSILTLINTNNTDNNQNSLDFATSASQSIAKIIGKNDSHSSRNGSLIFATSAGSAPSERLRITSAGLVGINCTPNKQLEVKGTDVAFRLLSTAATGRIGMEFYDTSAQKGYFGYASSSNDEMSIQQNEAADLWFYVNGGERLRIDSNGKTFIHATGATGANDTSTRISNGNTLNIHGTSSVDGVSVVRYSDTYGCYGLNIGKSNSDTFGTNTLVTQGEELGHVSFYGADGSNFELAAQITGEVDINGAPTNGTDMPGALSFRTSPDGSATPSERLKIDCRGFVGINETNPDRQLHMSANNNGVSANAYTSANNILRLTDTDTDVTTNQPGGTIEWETRDSTAAGVNAYIATKNSNTGYSSMHFGTGNASTLASRFTISQTGDVGIGDDLTPSSKLHIVDGAGTTVKLGNTTNASTANIAYNWGGSFGLKCDPDDNAGGTKHIYMQVAGTTYFNLSDNGKITSIGTYNGTTTGGGAVYVESDGDLLRYTSSRKYKTDIETAEDKYADQILTTRPVWYRSTSDNDIKDAGKGKSDFGWFGFIAEEIAEINPRLVNYKTKESQQQSDGTLKSVELNPSAYEAESVRYTDFIPLMVNLLKRQSDKITALEADVASLKSS
jgi:hypothetical protein